MVKITYDVLTIPDRHNNMSIRKVPLVTNAIYHICNRGVNKAPIFFSEEDYSRLFLTAVHYRTKSSKFSDKRNDPGSEILEIAHMQPKVQILAYCFMPNHFHFLIKQIVDGGVTWYMQHVINSYVHYVNTKYKRVGPLLQGRFRNVHVESDEQLLHVNRYIHLNPLVANIVSDLNDYHWSSYKNYVSGLDDRLCDASSILQHFASRENYSKFVLDQVDYARELEKIKHFLLN